MKIREVIKADSKEWLRMRKALWPHHIPDELASEMKTILEGGKFSNELEWVVYVLVRENGALGGFIETSIHPHEDNCETNPVGYIESWWIDYDLRKQDMGKQLVKKAEEWALSKGCKEMASDTDDWRKTSIIAHQALDYEITSKVKGIKFKKWIGRE